MTPNPLSIPSVRNRHEEVSALMILTKTGAKKLALLQDVALRRKPWQGIDRVPRTAHAQGALPKLYHPIDFWFLRFTRQPHKAGSYFFNLRDNTGKDLWHDFDATHWTIALQLWEL